MKQTDSPAWRVPFSDISGQYRSLKAQIDAVVSEVLESGAYAGGPFVARFEQVFAAAQGLPYCAGLNSGTSALVAGLHALGCRHGDEVIVPANSFIATAEAVSLCGAIPVFADCDEYGGLSPASLEELYSPRCKGIIPVHLYGQCADMNAIMDFARQKGLFVLEDCAQAHLATLDGVPAGAWGDGGCFSFYPGKNLGACGEGGAFVCSNEALYQHVQLFKNHGSKQRYQHEMIGLNGRMEGLQAAILSVKLASLEVWTQRRSELAALYTQNLGALAAASVLELPLQRPNSRHSWHLYVIHCAEPEQLAAFLAARGMETLRHYPVPCHTQKAYSGPAAAPCRVPAAGLPEVERRAARLLSLPLHERLSDDQVLEVCDAIQEFFQSGGQW